MQQSEIGPARLAANIPPEVGRLAVVTGATRGLGYETALALAQAGADVIITGRNQSNGHEVVGRIRPQAPAALVRFERLDLASLASVADFAGRLVDAGRPVDMLINNASVRTLPRRQVTVDGFEMQIGTNYLGHYALTARLLPLLRKGHRPRVVQISSAAHRHGTIHLDDLQLERGYTPWQAHCQSKLAMLMFALELQRQSDARGWRLLSTAAQPRQSSRDRIASMPERKGHFAWFRRAMGFVPNRVEVSALPTLFAATSSEAQPSGYYGPEGLSGQIRQPGSAVVSENARDVAVARRLWELSAQLTGVEWPVG